MKRSRRIALAACLPVLSWILLLLVTGYSTAAEAQRIDSLPQVKTLCIEPFHGGAEGAHLRDSLVRKLSRSGRFQIVPSAKETDAILRGTGQIWVRGHITINPRTPAYDREAVYGGYLSLEVVGADAQPLWSWLVTPVKLSWSSIVDNLAGQAAKKLVDAAESTSAGSPGPSPAGSLVQTSLTSAGATFPAPLYQKWFEDFELLHPGVRIRYSPIGSQAGVENLLAGTIDFAGSDVSPDVVAGAASTAKLRRIASVLGAVVPIYNIKGVTQDIRFTPETLAGIYMGKVRRWNDPEILRSNRGLNLPDAEIVVVHRSDGSGTSWVWSDFLSKASPAWSTSVGRGATLQWPVGIGAERNEGVVDAVENTPNSIGYVELTYAIQHQLSFAAVRNRSGEYVRASLDSLAEAARSAGVTGEPPATITDPPGKYAYPIAAFTWLLVPSDTVDVAKKRALIELLRWILTSGQKECAALGYAPLAHEVAESELKLLNNLP